MNLRHLSDEILHIEIIRHVAEEREKLVVILHHLREIERRRLFSAHRCPSLHEYATRHLGYSDDQACRRIAAMRLLKELPEIEAKIADGRLTLSNLGLAQTLFRSEAKQSALSDGEKPTQKALETHGLSKPEKLEVLASLEGKSVREAKRVVLEASSVPETLFDSTLRPASCAKDQITIPTDLSGRLERLKGLIAHKHPNLSMVELLSLMVDLAEDAWDPSRKPKAKRSSPATSRVNSRYIPATIKREVWERDHSKCSNCNSTFALQIDHRVGYAKGGASETQNLRLLCRTCNQRAAIEQYGDRKMRSYIRSPKASYHVSARALPH